MEVVDPELCCLAGKSTDTLSSAAACQDITRNSWLQPHKLCPALMLVRKRVHTLQSGQR